MAEGGQDLNFWEELPFPRQTINGITILSWNIHGKSGSKSKARNLLAPCVVDHVDPDVLLLQETRTKKLVKKIKQQQQQCRTYTIYEPGNPQDKTEARVVYDSVAFEPTNEQMDLDMLVTNAFPNAPVPVELNEVKSTLKSRVAIVRLRHKETQRVFVFMSFHNNYKVTVEKRQFFARVLCRCVSAGMVPNDTLVVAGADFNIEIMESEHGETHVPEYDETQRRAGNKIDYFVAKDHHITVQGQVSALDIFNENELSQVWQSVNMVAHQLTQDQFREALDHDPLVYNLTL